MEEVPVGSDDLHYYVDWSDEDQKYVAYVHEYPSLSWLASTPAEARAKLKELIKEENLTPQQVREWDDDPL